MIKKLLVVFILYKNINSFSAQAKSWDGFSPKTITENTNTKRQKPSRSYMANPLLTSKEIAESIFPDVIYPSSILDAREPFYFTTMGTDDLLRPFSDDVKNSYKSLTSEKDNKYNLTKHKPQSIQNTKSSNKNLKAPILQENNINNSKIFNCDDGAIQQNSETKLDVATISYDLLNIKDDIEFRNFCYNLDNIIKSISLQEMECQRPLEMPTSINQCTQSNTTNDIYMEYLDMKAISNNVEECVVLRELNKAEVKSDVNITVINEDDTKVVSNNVEESIIVKVLKEPEIKSGVSITFIGENKNTKTVSNNVGESIIVKVLKEPEIKSDANITFISEDNNTKTVSNNVGGSIIVKILKEPEIKSDVNITFISVDNNTMTVSNNVEECVIVKEGNKTEFKNEVNIIVISEDRNVISNDTNGFEWAKYENETFSDDVNHFINYNLNNISESEYLKKLLKTKKNYDLILYILQNCDDTDYVFFNISLLTRDTITQDSQLIEYYDNVESENEDISDNNRNKFSEICDSYLDYIEGESKIINTSMEMVPDNDNNSSETPCILSCDKSNESNEISSTDDIAFDIIEIICDCPEEPYVKSSASSIVSTFDGFKSSKNPFYVLFDHFPSSTISDT